MKLVALLGVLVTFGLFIWSFSQTDPNLLFINNSNWLGFQNLVWQVPLPTLTSLYIVCITLIFVLYLSALTAKMGKRWIIPFVLIVGLLLCSNNALSHDLYNYMFNAKAVAIYHANPHLQSALDIAPKDEWVRFMHNVHTTAPYGQFWTAVSLVPYVLGIGKFLTTFLSFKLFMLFGFAVLVWIQKQMNAKSILFFVLNPLVLIETVMNGHNDVWMMALALGSFALILRVKKTFSWQVFISFVLLILSTQIKLATVVLFPLWFGLVFLRVSWIKKYWAEIATVLLFLPLLTDRSQQFNPWYLIWPLTFLPFIQSRFLKLLLITFSLTSLLRYVPFLLSHEYTDAIQFQMRLITWSAIPITSVLAVIARKKTR